MEIFIPLTLWENFSERAIDDCIDVVLFLNFSLLSKIKGYFDQDSSFLNHQSRFSKSSGVSIPIPTCVVSTILIRFPNSR
jgi:hypothetical protein